MKTTKRILSVLLLVVLGLLVGYLVYTGSRLPSEKVSTTSQILEVFGKGITLC